MKLTFDNSSIELTPTGKGYLASAGEKTLEVEIVEAQDGKLTLRIDGQTVTAQVNSDNAKRWVTIHGRTYLFTKQSASRRKGSKSDHSSELTAPMPGQVRSVNVNEGDPVTKGQTLMILEAMKMEIRIQAQDDGIVKRIHTQQGQTVEREQVLITVE